MPKLVADPKRKEDVLKVDADRHGNNGDDEYDDVRYGLMERRTNQILDYYKQRAEARKQQGAANG